MQQCDRGTGDWTGNGDLVMGGLDNPDHLTQAVKYGGMCTGKEIRFIILGLSYQWVTGSSLLFSVCLIFITGSMQTLELHFLMSLPNTLIL